MTTARTALKIVLLWCWLFASIDCGKGEKKPEQSIDLSTVVECVGESWHEDLKSIRPYVPSSVDEYLHAKKGLDPDKRVRCFTIHPIDHMNHECPHSTFKPRNKKKNTCLKKITIW